MGGSRLSKLKSKQPKRQDDQSVQDTFDDMLSDDLVNDAAIAEGKKDSVIAELEAGGEYKPPPKRRTTPRIAELRARLRAKLLSAPNEFDAYDRYDEEAVNTITERLKTMLQKARIQISPEEYKELETGLLNDILGFGAIQSLIENKGYSEVMVNGPEVIFAEYKGKLQETEYVFDDDDHAQYTAQRIVRPLQRDLSRRNPMVDARLPDGSRVHAIIQPSALQGTTLTIRKFPEKRLTWRDLVSFGSFTNDVAEFLAACVKIRLNIVVSGGTGSGKTTLLNVISSFIPEDERIVTIEDSAELNMAQRHVVRLETTPYMQGTTDGMLTIRDLVKGSLRMRPDRVVVGEIRDGAALDMLQAMNTGHDGSLTTVHANGPREAVARLETLCLMAGMDMPLITIRSQIASAIHLFVQQARLKDGSRKIIQVTEVQGMEGETVTLQDIFVYRTEHHTGVGPSHEGGGNLEPTGMRPKFADRFKDAGINMGADVFGGRSKIF